MPVTGFGSILLDTKHKIPSFHFNTLPLLNTNFCFVKPFTHTTEINKARIVNHLPVSHGLAWNVRSVTGYYEVCNNHHRKRERNNTLLLSRHTYNTDTV